MVGNKGKRERYPLAVNVIPHTPQDVTAGAHRRTMATTRGVRRAPMDEATDGGKLKANREDFSMVKEDFDC